MRRPGVARPATPDHIGTLIHLTEVAESIDMAARLTRQEMKRDEVMESLGSVIGYIRTHPKVALGVVAGILVAGLAVLGVVRYRAHQTAMANDALAKALDIIHAPVGPEVQGDPSFKTEAERDEKASAALTGVIEAYGSTGAAQSARLLLAAQVASEGDLDRAMSLWREVKKEGSGSVAAEAELNLIMQLRNAGKSEEVMTMLREQMQNNEGPLPPDVVMGELAETLQQSGKSAEAEQLRQKLAESYPNSPYNPQAQQGNAGALPGAAGTDAG
jgi:tetratricopeptide (TPR) repeat protein